MLKIRQPLPRQSPIVQVVIIGILLATPFFTVQIIDSADDIED
jgi:hypothetical protein